MKWNDNEDDNDENDDDNDNKQIDMIKSDNEVGHLLWEESQ